MLERGGPTIPGVATAHASHLMRITTVLAILLALGASQAWALSVDAKRLARFDVGYAGCEERYADMRGHRDEAYLSLWRVRADEKTLAQLAATRRSADYRKERQRALQAAKAASAPASSSLDQQCRALSAERQRIANPKHS
jgi:hypothetical protein